MPPRFRSSHMLLERIEGLRICFDAFSYDRVGCSSSDELRKVEVAAPRRVRMLNSSRKKYNAFAAAAFHSKADLVEATHTNSA